MYSREGLKNGAPGAHSGSDGTAEKFPSMMPLPPPHTPSCLACRLSVLPAYHHWAPTLGRGGPPAPTGSMPHPFSGSPHTLHTLLLRTLPLTPCRLLLQASAITSSNSLPTYPHIGCDACLLQFSGENVWAFLGNMWVHAQEWDRTKGTCASPLVSSVSGTITTC